MVYKASSKKIKKNGVKKVFMVGLKETLLKKIASNKTPTTTSSKIFFF
jgi:hypothetical protein